MNKITIISMGAGNPDLLTIEAKNALENIDIAIGAKRFEDFDLKIPLVVPGKLIKDTIDEIYNHKDKKVGLLVTGDAGFYSLAKSVIKEFGKENVKVIPGISIVQLAFSRICEPWHKASFYSVHGRNRVAIEKIKLEDRFLLLCDNKNTASSIVKEISDMIVTHNIFVMENLSFENERILEINNLKDIEKINDESLSLIVGIVKS